MLVPYNAGAAYGNSMGHNESDATTHYPVAQNIYGDGYGVAQVCKLCAFTFC